MLDHGVVTQRTTQPLGLLILLGDTGQRLAGMKPGTPSLQLQCLAGEDFLQLVGAGEQQPAVRRLIQQLPNGLQALNRQML